MEKVRQSMRPKHQVLILKCYPKFQKNVADIKPNSSELSYLLYYASTRRSKVQKVGAFLEKKTASDVYKGRTGNVQVTLRILAALIEKTPRDLSLYAPYVLRILRDVLKSNDLTMVEDSVPTFNAFCENQEVATFAADQELVKLYEEVVKTYAGLAARTSTQQSRTPRSAPVAHRWRIAGIQALKSVTAAEAVGADGGRQLAIVMPAILENLYSDNDQYLMALYNRAEVNEKEEKENALRRRMSVTTTPTPPAPTESLDSSSTNLSVTTADADRLAEEEVGLIALQCLKQIFVVNNRAQIRLATPPLLRYMTGIAMTDRPRTSKSTKSLRINDWASAVMEVVTRWVPVQDRFIILVTMVETLVRSPIAEENLDQQLVFATLVDALLSSSINMIGLSVMDVLLGLVQHVLLLLQLGGRGSNVLPHYQQTDAIDLFKDSVTFRNPLPGTVHRESKDVQSASTTRQTLLVRLQSCIGALANHIYYSDQIPDMIAAILLRLKPSTSSPIASTVTAIENPGLAAQAISDSIHMQEDPRTDEFFSFGTARVTALYAIKDILLVANSKATVTGAGAIGRNRVGVQIWEGTQWLLRDEDRRVRRAYVDALVTWLRCEMGKDDLRVMDDRDHSPKRKSAHTNDLLVQRAASTTSKPSATPRHEKSTFLQLLHLAIYDNALETPEEASEILLLHLLLYRLVEKLGVNAIKSGLPMMCRLQEDINVDALVKSPVAKINVGSLVHGYFWLICERFEIDTTIAGYGVMDEIKRRKQHGLWLEAVHLPPVSLDRITVAGSSRTVAISPADAEHESLRPFDKIRSLVEEITAEYLRGMTSSPPASPPTSPGRSMNIPILSGPHSSEHKLPSSFKEAMLSTWTKDSCIALVKRSSPHGSRTGTVRSGNGYLHANRDGSPASAQGVVTGRKADAQGSPQGRLSHLQINKMSLPESQANNQTTDPTSPVSSTDQAVLHVDDLKRVLAGTSLADTLASVQSRGRPGSPLRRSNIADHDFMKRSISLGSESIVDDEGFLSEIEEDSSDRQYAGPTETANRIVQQSEAHRSVAGSINHPSRHSNPYTTAVRPRSSSTASGEDPEANARALKGDIQPPLSVNSGMSDGNDSVPPVPPLPEGIVGKVHINHAPVSQPPRSNAGRMGGKTTSVGRSSGRAVSLGPSDRRSVLTDQLLRGIEVGEVGGKRGMGRPPY